MLLIIINFFKNILKKTHNLAFYGTLPPRGLPAVTGSQHAVSTCLEHLPSPSGSFLPYDQANSSFVDPAWYGHASVVFCHTVSPPTKVVGVIES